MPRLPFLLAIVGLAATPALADNVTAKFNGIGGSVTLVPGPKGVLVKIDATGLTPGWHAVHFHEKGTCDDAGFKMAGSHTHAGTSVHGLLNPAATDTGDLTNIYAGADGTAKAEIYSSLLILSDLQDEDGSAVVVHAKADDYTTQPIGGAGDRVGCAVIK